MPGTPRSRTGCRLAPVLALTAVVVCGGVAVADDVVTDRRLPTLVLPGDLASAGTPVGGVGIEGFRPPRQAIRPVAVKRNRFYHGHLLPRLSRQMNAIAPHDPVLAARGMGHDQFYTEFSRTVGSRAGSSAYKALRDYVLDDTAVAGWIGNVERKVDPFAHKQSDGRPKNVSFHFGLSHGLPRVELKHRSAIGMLRFRVALEGSARIEFRPLGSRNTYFTAGANLDGETTIHCRFEF